MLRVPGRARAAHIVQFRPIGAECPGEELAQEGAEFCDGFCLSGAAVRRGVKRCRTDRSHDASLLCFHSRRRAARDAFFGAWNDLSPDSLKDGFNCTGSRPHMVIEPVIIRGERMENGSPRLPFRGRAATSAAANFRKFQQFPGTAMARQFVYFMQGLTKSYPTRKVLDNVHLSFYPDAKIGVLGVNGSGKSTLLKIMAGLDKEYNGEAWVAEGARVGYLEQEPQLDASKSVRENVMEGVAKQKAILDRYNELAMNYSEETADEMTKLQDQIEAAGLWDLDSKVDQAMDALRCPPDDADVDQALGRRAPPRRAVQAAARPAGAAAARRADQPSRRRIRVVAGRPSAQLSGRDPDRDPRSLLPRQRHRLDPRTRSRQGHSLRGQLLVLAAAEAEAPGAGGPRGCRAPEDAGPRAGVDRVLTKGAPGQVQGALSAL